MFLKYAAVLILTGLLTVSAPAAAMAQTSEQAEALRFRIGMARSFAEDEGYTPTAGPFFGALRNGDTQVFLLPVSGRQDYIMVAVCDAACNNLDIRVYDPGKAIIGEDVLEDSAPTVYYRLEHDGEVSVEVQMVSCSSEPCYFVVEAYRPF